MLASFTRRRFRAVVAAAAALLLPAPPARASVEAPAIVKDVFAGADPTYSVPYRFVGEFATHAMFAHNMFPKDLQGVGNVGFVKIYPGNGCKEEKAENDIKTYWCNVPCPPSPE